MKKFCESKYKKSFGCFHFQSPCVRTNARAAQIICAKFMSCSIQPVCLNVRTSLNSEIYGRNCGRVFFSGSDLLFWSGQKSIASVVFVFFILIYFLFFHFSTPVAIFVEVNHMRHDVSALCKSLLVSSVTGFSGRGGEWN